MNTPAFGTFGERGSDVPRTEFFAFFHLGEESRERNGAGEAIRYRPTADQFHDAVLVEVKTDENDRVQGLYLFLKRSFIDNDALAPFARDVAKSFAGGGLTQQSDYDTLSDLITDLVHRPMGSRTVLRNVPQDEGGEGPDALLDAMQDAVERGEQVVATLGPRSRAPAPVDLPVIVSRGFAVYQGDREAVVRDLARTRFAMQNTTMDGAPVLRTSFERL